MGGAYGEKKTIRRCVALEAEFVQMSVPLAPQIQMRHFLSLIKECFIYNDDDVLSWNLWDVLMVQRLVYAERSRQIRFFIS